MRLICPNCDAQYEVADDVIPADGRDVQCSNCGQTWYQHHPDHMPQMDEAVADTLPPDLEDVEDIQGDDEERVEATPPPPPDVEEDAPEPAMERPTLKEGVADILREEAERETQARSTEGLESQPDLGLQEGEDEAAKRARQARARMARLRGEDPEPEIPVDRAAVGARRDLLPDIEEINSTLRATSGRDTRSTDTETDPASGTAKSSGFRRGFLSVVILAAVAGAIYVFAPQLAETVPQTAPMLETFTQSVDASRIWLDGQLIKVLNWLDMVAESEG